MQIPGGLLKLAVPFSRLVEKLVTLPETYSAEGLRNSAGTTYLGDNSKAKRELGYQPRPIEAGLPETMAWEMERLGLTPPMNS
jgi:dihydroflavonol-4-reductase